MAKENKKFVYKEVNNKQARAKDYEAAIAWLKDSGLIYPINRLSKPAMPISAYIGRFKSDNCIKIQNCGTHMVPRNISLDFDKIKNLDIL